MAKFKLKRRAFLAGIGGTAVALPFLEAMDTKEARAAGGAIPCRYVIGFGGVSMPRQQDLVVPGSTGTDFTFPRAFAPLNAVKEHVSIVTNLKIPWQTGSSIPAGGRPVEFHTSTTSPVLSGVASETSGARTHGETSDQIAARAVNGEDEMPFPSLEYRVQAESYRGGASKGRMSFEDRGGDIQPREPIASPRLAFDQLFRGFVPDDAAEAERAAFLLSQDRSVLDLVGDRAERLVNRLGRQDKVRLEQHFDEIRSLETRLVTSEVMGACMLLPDPGDDSPAMSYPEAGGTGRIIGYAQEESRAEVLTDLIHMALVCDRSRVVSMQYTYAQTFLSAQELFGVSADVHELSHGAGSQTDWADSLAWHSRHWGALIQKLADTNEGAGTVLDNTALSLVFEGGNGNDPEGGDTNSPHSTENMVALVAGRPSAMNLGQHIDAGERHPAQVSLSAMRSVGVEENLGALTDPISELMR